MITMRFFPMRALVIFLVLYLSVAMAEDGKNAYYYDSNSTCYKVLGVDGEEGVADAILAINSGEFGFISGQDYANTTLILTQDKQLKDFIYSGLPGCHKFPHLPVDMVKGDAIVARIRQPENKTSIPNDKNCFVTCSITYSAWYNTTIANYLLRHRDVLSRFRRRDKNIEQFCLPDYPYENNNILQMWDDSGKPISGVPEYPW